MPGLRVIRPADANEVAAAWQVHLDGDGPTALLLTRQKIPVLDGTAERAPRRRRPAARTCSSPEGTAPARHRADRHRFRGRGVRRGARAARGAGVVGARRVDAVVGPVRGRSPTSTAPTCCRPVVPTLAVEAGVRFGWERYADDVVSIDRFGASAPGDVVMRELGITPEHVVERARRVARRNP